MDKRQKIFPDQRYGRLVVLERIIDSKPSKYKCQCDCGNVKVVRGKDLRKGDTKSCGCYRRDLGRQSKFIHGLSKTKEYVAFYARRKRELKRKLDIYWTPEMEIALRKLQTVCVLCGSIDLLSIDHVRPLSKGYGLSPGNAVILCKSCNSKKNDKDLNMLPLEDQWKLISKSQEFLKLWYEGGPYVDT